MKSKKAAMEMSVGTIVTIVLLMSVLILGIFLVQKIFGSATNAIDSIDDQVQSEIGKLFDREDKKIAVYPTSRQITLKKKDDPKGFAFSVKNLGVESATFSYVVKAIDVSSCGNAFTTDRADSYLLGGSSSFPLGPGNSLDDPILVMFNLPENAPPCSMIYQIEVERDGENYAVSSIFVTIK